MCCKPSCKIISVCWSKDQTDSIASDRPISSSIGKTEYIDMKAKNLLLSTLHAKFADPVSGKFLKGRRLRDE